MKIFYQQLKMSEKCLVIGSKILGTFGTVLYKEIRSENIEVINLKKINKYDKELIVNYKGKEKKVKFNGNASVDDIINQIKI